LDIGGRIGGKRTRFLGLLIFDANSAPRQQGKGPNGCDRQQSGYEQENPNLGGLPLELAAL
jgi:hypothetical protein